MRAEISHLMIDVDNHLRARDAHQREPSNLLAAVRRRGRPVDLPLLLAVPLALVAIYLLPRPVKLDLALSYARPTVLTMFASHFVHLRLVHLLTNLAGYALLVPLAYTFCVLSGRRTHFYVAFVTILLAFPFALSALNVAFSRPAIGLGYSGIVMAFLGFLPLSLLWFVEIQFAPGVNANHSPLFYYLGTGLIAVWAVPPTLWTTAVVFVALLASAYYLRQLVAALDVSRPVRRWASRVGYAEIVLAGVLLYFAFPFAAFPPRVVGDGIVLNLYSHLLGYSFGFIVPYVAFGDVFPTAYLRGSAGDRGPRPR